MADIDQLLKDSHTEHSLLIRVSDVARITTLSERLIWQKVENDDAFPKPMKCGRLQLWSRREVVEWVAAGLDARVQR